MTIPDDIELAFPFRELQKRIGKNVWLVVGRLFCDLTHQAKYHGRCGRYEAKWWPHFLASINNGGIIGGEDVEAALLESQFVVRIGEDYFCELFYRANPQLDRSYIPPTAKWFRDWDKFVTKLAGRSSQIIDRLPQATWYLPNGDIIAKSVMSQSIVLINTLDIICRRDTRVVEDYTPQLIQTASVICSGHSPIKLSIALKRFLSVSRPFLRAQYPRTTEDCLRRFDDLVLLLLPDEGYEAWQKKIESPEHETEPQRATGITREMLEQSRIPVAG